MISQGNYDRVMYCVDRYRANLCHGVMLRPANMTVLEWELTRYICECEIDPRTKRKMEVEISRLRGRLAYIAGLA